MQERFARRVASLASGDPSRPIVVFCPNENCWLSYNAALRLRQAGYSDIAWFREGTAGWVRAGGRLEPTSSGW
jgi:PQQ-dependent catabolism-associated CXXCW motif protein